MERDELLPRSDQGSPPRTDYLTEGGIYGIGRIGSVPKLTRQHSAQPGDSFWSAAVVGTAISRDLVQKAERWKLLAEEPLTLSPAQRQHYSHSEYEQDCNYSTLPEVMPLLSHELNKYEVAAFYVQDALAGRESMVCIHDNRSLHALKIIRNKTWNHVLNVCTIFHLALPMLEVQRCLPVMGPQPVMSDSDALREGWRMTTLGSMWLECALCLLYTFDLYQVNLSRVCSRDHLHASRDKSQRGSDNRPGRNYLTQLPRWQVARTVMVFLLALGLCSNMVAHYVFRTTWHRWSRVTLPFLFISRRTYLKHFVGGMIRVLPRMLPVAFLMSFVIFFYAFLAYIVYRDEQLNNPFLGDLALFSEPCSAALTFLRIFMSIPFMLDVEELYQGRKFIRPLGLSYGVIMVIFLGALVPAVANRNFQYQSKESYDWVTEQRKLALTRAYLLFKGDDGMVGRDEWVSLMSFLRPDCDSEHMSALFSAAKLADTKLPELPGIQSVDLARRQSSSIDNFQSDRLSKGGLFMLCALGSATFSKPQKRVKYQGTYGRLRKRVHGALLWCIPGFHLSFSHLLLNVVVVIQGYQTVREGDSPEDRPAWASPLGGTLIAYYCVNAGLKMFALGVREYLGQWRHALGMALNCIGIAYYVGLWFPGEAWHSVYHILQAFRLTVLWNLLHQLGPTSSEVSKRLEIVFPAVLRASFVLFSVIYSYSVVGFAMYCATPLGIYELDPIASNTMVQRFAFYRHAISFASLHESIAAMTDVVMLSNWPIFMDAAGDVGNSVIARIFFYSFKGLTFYFVMPVMLGFIVQSYMAAKLPGTEANAQPFKPRPTSGTYSYKQPPPRRSGGTEDGDVIGISVGGSVNCAAATVGGGLNMQTDDNSRPYNESNFGYSTLADGAETQINAPMDEASQDASERSSEDKYYSDDDLAPVIVTSHKRSMSQAFWGTEQAKDHQGTKQASTMQETFTRVNTLESDNARLRALLDSMQTDLHMANARLHEEINQPLQSPVHQHSPSWLVRKSGAGGGVSGSPEMAATGRKRLGSANSIGGMESIVERDEEIDLL